MWRSEDRGDSWTAISGDLTRDQDRFQLPLMDQSWGWDAPWDMYAMSDYNTITSLAESPLVSGLMYAGTDDGLIHVTEDAGNTWRKVEVGSLPGVPGTAFVNDIRADLHEENTFYVALYNHKYGDLKPYLVVSKNRGKSWKSIAGDLPDEHLVWRLVQDHVKPGLMFIGTEFGVFMTQNAGKSWDKLSSGMPTISIRDIQIQRRENDLVAASFGRGFFVSTITHRFALSATRRWRKKGIYSAREPPIGISQSAFSATARKDRRAISFMWRIIHPLALTSHFI